MAENFFWAQGVVKEIVKVKKKVYVCEGMWTPSGFFHIGNARPEIFTPYSVYLVLKDQGYNTIQNFIIDDFDAVRKIPTGLGIKKSDEKKFIGFPCATAPSPVKGFKSWADFFVSDVREHIEDFGVDLNIISAHDTYKKGKFNELIKFSLDHSKEIVRTWNKVAGSEKPMSFLPVQVVCKKCKRIYFTEATKWDGKFLHYNCKACKARGEILPENGNVKLHWRVHWVCHWILHDVSFESGGKDHFSRGGSVEVGKALMTEVFKRPPIYQTPTEFIQLKGAKMSGSIGGTINLGDWLEIASPELFRYLNLSTRPNKVIELSFDDNNFLLLDERYSRATRIFYGKEKAENKKLEIQIKKAYKLSNISKVQKILPIQVPFSFAVLISQLFNAQKEMPKIEKLLIQSNHIKKKLSANERTLLQRRILRIGRWVEKYAPENFKVKFLETVKNSDLNKIKKEVKEVFPSIIIAVKKSKNAEQLQAEIFNIAKKNQISPKILFSSLYLIFLGRERGPKLGSLVFAIGKNKIIKRLTEIV